MVGGFQGPTRRKRPVDANALYPLYLRDLLLHLAEKGLYEVRWTDQILQEAARNIKKRLPEERHDRIDRMVAKMNEAFNEARVIGYEDLIPAMRNHPKDRHVLAAAVKADVDVVVTENKKDFPRNACDQYDIEVLTPDGFLMCQWSLWDPVVFCTILEELIHSYSKPSYSLGEIANKRWNTAAPEFSNAVVQYVGI